MHTRIDDFAKPITLEKSRGEVKLSADIISYYAKNAESFLKAEKLNPGSGEAMVESTPIGVLFGVEPWNFPVRRCS